MSIKAHDCYNLIGLFTGETTTPVCMCAHVHEYITCKLNVHMCM